MKKYQLSPKLEKTLKRNRRLWRNGGKTVTLAIAFILIGIIGKSMWDGYWRSHEWTWQSPVRVEFRTPLIIKELKPQAQRLLSPIPDEKTQSSGVLGANLGTTYKTEYELVMSKPHGELLWKIFNRESSLGKNDACRQRGVGFNGLGLGESDEYIRLHGANCFATKEALWSRAEKAITDFGVDRNEPKAVCRWKFGDTFNQPNCQYYQEVISWL